MDVTPHELSINIKQYLSQGYSIKEVKAGSDAQGISLEVWNDAIQIVNVDLLIDEQIEKAHKKRKRPPYIRIVLYLLGLIIVFYGFIFWMTMVSPTELIKDPQSVLKSFLTTNPITLWQSVSN